MVEVDRTYQFQSKVGRIDQELRYISSITYHNLLYQIIKKKQRDQKELAMKTYIRRNTPKKLPPRIPQQGTISRSTKDEQITLQ